MGMRLMADTIWEHVEGVLGEGGLTARIAGGMQQYSSMVKPSSCAVLLPVAHVGFPAAADAIRQHWRGQPTQTG